MLHRAAGLTVQADRNLPWFPLASSGLPADLAVHLESRPNWADEADVPLFISEADDSARPQVKVSQSLHGSRFEYSDGTSVWVGRAARDVWCTWPDSATLADTATYLAGPILSFVLRLRGALVLHASAVAVGDRALVLAGPHGAGKSTLASALALRGAPLIADDVVHVLRADDDWIAEPFTGPLRLWPDAEELLFGTRGRLPRLTPSWDKRALGVGSHGVEPVTTRHRVAAIVILEFAEQQPLHVASLAPADAFIRLTANTSATHLIDLHQRAAEFRTLAALVRAVPVGRLSRTATAGIESQITALRDWLDETA